MASKQDIDDIVSLFFSVGRSLRHKFDAADLSSHLSVTHLETLRFICERKSVAMKDLSEFLSITPPSTTVLVQHLIGHRLVQRQQDKTDRRAVYLSLTKTGANVLQTTLKSKMKNFAALLKNLNQNEQGQLLQILNKMVIKQ